MKYPERRPTTAIGKTMIGYAVFASVRESVIDYAIWQTMYARNMSRDDYFRKLSVYAEDEHYIYKIKRIINENKN